MINLGPDLSPYTSYEYKVVAGNSKGDVSSPWSIVRTLEAPPVGLNIPMIDSTDAYSFAASWQPPQSPNGVITKYMLHYRLLTNDPTIVNFLQVVTFDPTILKTSVSALKPFSNYQMHITAYNMKGNVSSSQILVQTHQSSPSGLPMFRIEKISSGTSVILRWDSPGQPNGVISIYNIYEEGTVNAIYKGLNREFEFRRLEPFTSYQVWLEACTIVGCTRGVKQEFTTAETPPTDQSAPVAGQVNATAIVITWNKPVQPNGQISRYVTNIVELFHTDQQNIYNIYLIKTQWNFN